MLDGIIDFHIYFSENSYRGIDSSSIEVEFTREEMKKLHLIKNRTIRAFLWWQKEILKTLIKKDYDVVVFLGDMKILSNWIGILICKLRKKKIFKRFNFSCIWRWNNRWSRWLRSFSILQRIKLSINSNNFNCTNW